MKRTNVYLGTDQLERLRLLGERRGLPVAELVRQAIDSWLETQGVRAVTEDEWQRRFDALIERRRGVAAELGVDEERLRRDVALAVRDARKARARSR
jgi:Ribbon-helix-helix protein, copG family